ncbi:glucose/mannose transport system permease protein, partial [Candidatus Hakubella thermalkaliphila]
GADTAPTDVPALLMFLTTFRANQFAEGAAIGIKKTVRKNPSPLGLRSSTMARLKPTTRQPAIC